MAFVVNSASGSAGGDVVDAAGMVVVIVLVVELVVELVVDVEVIEVEAVDVEVLAGVTPLESPASAHPVRSIAVATAHWIIRMHDGPTRVRGDSVSS